MGKEREKIFNIGDSEYEFLGKKDRRMLLWKRTERVREERVWEREKGRESVLKALTVRLCVRESGGEESV